MTFIKRYPFIGCILYTFCNPTTSSFFIQIDISNCFFFFPLL